jgi:hypothetical protein
MPLWLRKYTFSKIRNYFESQNQKSHEDSVQTSIRNLKMAKNTGIAQSPSLPSYKTKASKK